MRYTDHTKTHIVDAFLTTPRERSQRRRILAFIAAYNAGDVEVPADVRGECPKLVETTLALWVRARAAVEAERAAVAPSPDLPEPAPAPAPAPAPEPAVLPVTAIHRFEGQRLTTVEHQGQPCWVAREVGAALGYGDEGGGFSKKVAADWAEDFTEGEDFYRVTGDCLAALGQLGGGETPPPNPRGGNHRDLLLLTEQGVWLGCILSRKPAGRRLRRWLAREVLPSLRSTGSYALGPGGAVAQTKPPRRVPADLETMAPEDRWWRVQQLRELTGHQAALGLLSREEQQLRLDLAASITAGVAVGGCHG
jgi:prophage antirepressor-like protein